MNNPPTTLRQKEAFLKISQSKKRIFREKLLKQIQSFDLSEINKCNCFLKLSPQKFKNKIINGATIEELTKEHGRHLIQFYSRLFQNEIRISKNELEGLYNEGKSLKEICGAFNIPMDYSRFVLRIYGLKKKGANFIKRKKNQKAISEIGKQIIIGSLLGDGGITKGGSFAEKHSEKQYLYLLWKYNNLLEIMQPKALSTYKCFDKRSGNLIFSCIMNSGIHDFLIELRKLFYPNGIKVVPDDIENMLTPLSLAVWFMDDGSTDWGGAKSIGNYNVQPSSKFSTQCFDDGSLEKLTLALKNKFKIEAKINKRKEIRLSTVETQKLFEIITPYITEELLYKVSKKDHDNKMSHKPTEKDKLESIKIISEKFKSLNEIICTCI
jgi:hypothetical protein